MTASETLTIRIDPELKAQADRAAKSEDRNLTDFVIRAVKHRLAAHCEHCGRADRPDGGPGFSPAFDRFLESMRDNAGTITIAATVMGRPTVYCGRLVRTEPSQGFLLMFVDFRQGKQWATTATLPIPRGLIAGWQDDPSKTHYEELLSLGYANGNDQTVRAYLRSNGCRVATLRVVCEAICDSAPGVTWSELSSMVNGVAIKQTLDLLVQSGLIAMSVNEGRITSRYGSDADAMLRDARRCGINVDEVYY